MMNPLAKFIFLLRKPKIIVVTGKERQRTSEAIFEVLSPYFKVKRLVEKAPSVFGSLNKTFIVETDLRSLKLAKKLSFLMKNSKLPILVATSSEGEKEIEEIKNLSKSLLWTTFFVFNWDDKALQEASRFINLKTLNFGFEEGSDFRASDIKINGGTNFKINYKGKIIPIWLDKPATKEQIGAALVASAIGTAFGLNFVEVAEALK